MRAGQAAFRSIEDLAEKSGVGVRTIIRLEAADGIPPSRTQTLLDIKAALEAGGIDFIGRPGHTALAARRTRRSWLVRFKKMSRRQSAAGSRSIVEADERDEKPFRPSASSLLATGQFNPRFLPLQRKKGLRHECVRPGLTQALAHP